MSNCIRLRTPDKPFAAMPFRQDVWDRLGQIKEITFGDSDDPFRWIDWFACDGGTVERKDRPDRIVFYMTLCTTREMRFYVRSIKDLGGWMVDFYVGNEYDNYRTTYRWEL